jgi:murein DD-endopeptidase MepM/ murein hydrolase activator NlpD
MLSPIVTIGLFLAVNDPTVADDASPREAVLDQAATRCKILEEQRRKAAEITRERLLLAYRTSQKRALQFTTLPHDRLNQTQTFDRALLVLRNTYEESQALSEELAQAKRDHSTLERAFLTSAFPEKATNKPAPLAVKTPSFQRPVHGTPVSKPGRRRDGSSKVELQHWDVEWLVRLNEPVRTIAPGVIRRIETLPQGGFAILIDHSDGYTSIISGLRDTLVRVGQPVTAGQAIAQAGRNLDGAAVVSLEIWYRREPLDAGKLLSIRLRN